MRRLRLPAFCISLVLATGWMWGTVMVEVAHAAPAAIIISDETGQFERVDPVVSPGAVSAHEHHFWGAGTPADPVTPNTDTSAEFRALPSNWGTHGNFSGMWTMSLFLNGERVRQGSQHGTLAYYQGVRGTEQVPPENTMGVSHECGWRAQTGGGSVTDSPPARSDTGFLVLKCTIRGGRDLGLSQPFPNITTYTRYKVPVGSLAGLTCGGPAGSSYTHPCSDGHIDYVWAWDRLVFQKFLDQCVIPGNACGRDPQF